MTTLRRHALALAASCSFFASTAYGQSALELPELTVEGGPIGSAVQTANDVRRAAPNAKVVIEGEQLNQFNDLSVGDAIRRLPGVTFPGVNRSRDIKLRGLGKEYTQVLLDGRPIIDGDSSRNMEIDRIPAIFIDRIEITRSPLVSLGSEGVAGTVNIITKRNFGPAGGALSASIGHVENFGTPGAVSGWTGGQAGPLRYFLGGGYQRRLLEESSTTWNYTTNALTPNRRTAEDQKRTFDEYTALGRFEYQATPFDTLIFSPSYLRTDERRAQSSERTNAAMTYVDRRTDELRSRTRESYGSYLEWVHVYDKILTGRIFLDAQKAREDTARTSLQTSYRANGTVSGTTPGYTFNPIELIRIAPGASFVADIAGHTIEGGAGLNRLTRSENDSGRSDGSRTYEMTENVLYGYVSDSFSLFGPDKLTAGVRLEHSITSITNAVGVTESESSTNLNPSFQYKVAVAPDLDLRAGIARTLRRPDLRDLSSIVRRNDGTIAKPDTRGNPNTVPEKAWGADIGADYYFYDRLGILSFNFFARDFSDKLERRLIRGYAGEPTRWIAESRNAGDGKAYGLELEGRIPLRMLNAPNLTLWANATFIRSELNDPETGQTRRFSEQPDTIFNVGLDYYIEAWKTTLGVNFNRVGSYSQDILQVSSSGGVRTLFNERSEFNALNRLDASVKVALTDNFSLTFSALNLTRPVYRVHKTTFTPAGAIDSVELYEEPSHSTYMVRGTYTW